MFKKNYNQKKRQQTYLIILFFLLVVFILLLTGLRNNQNIGLKINWLLNKISKTTTWSDIRYGAELYIDEIKQDAVLFFNNNPSKLDKLSIKIKPADLRRIENIVKSKNIKDNLNDEDEKWYPISLSHNSKIYPAKIRIRGDQSIHWINKKKSWKIKFKQENLYKRKKSIDLIIPKERFMEVELTAYTIAKKYGLLVPDSSFILLEQNGKNMGLYFLKEKICTRIEF